MAYMECRDCLLAFDVNCSILFYMNLYDVWLQGGN